MQNENAKFKAIQSATYRADNSSNAGRSLDVSAMVRVDNGVVTSISDGIVGKAGVQVATFRCGGSMPGMAGAMTTKSVDFFSQDDEEAVVAEIKAFVAGVQTLTEAQNASAAKEG